MGAEKDTTNNRMELTAAIKALEAIKKPSSIILTTDSNYVKDGISKWIHGWIKNGWKTASKQPVKNADLWQQLLALTKVHELEWCWVKGHSGHRENEIADQLANEAIDAMMAKE